MNFEEEKEDQNTELRPEASVFRNCQGSVFDYVAKYEGTSMTLKPFSFTNDQGEIELFDTGTMSFEA